jgi:hypothetical protein
MNRWYLRIAVACLAGAVPRIGSAQSDTEVALAETLYQQGRQLLAQGKMSEACPKFAESHRLAPATGALLNLAFCHEAEQKLATAWLEYSEGMARARRDRRQDRVQFAEQRLAAIEPKLSHLTLVTDPGADGVAELEIRVDGIALGNAARGAPIPLNRGEHIVEARAPARAPWSERVVVDREAMKIVVRVPVLASEASAPGTASPPEGTATRTGAEQPSRPVPSSVHVAGAVTLGLGAGAIATGIVYMVRLSKFTNVQTDAEEPASKRWGLINGAFWAGTAVGAGVTGCLYFTRPAVPSSTGQAPAPNTSSARLVPWVTPSGAGLGLVGTL